MLAVLGAAVLWGTTGTAQALGPVGSDPVSVGALRILLGAAVLVVLATAARRRGGTVPTLPGRLPRGVVVLVGGTCVGAYQVCFFLGVDRAGVAVGTVVALGIAPFATGLLGLLLDERVDRRWIVSTAIAVLGVVLLVTASGGSASGVALVGVAAAVGAGLSYAGFTVAARSLMVRGMPGITVMAGFFGLGALLLTPLLLRADLEWLWTGRGALMVLWLGVVATGMAYVLFQHALAGLPPGTVATLSLAEPVTATLLGLLLLREEVSALTVAGIGVVVLGLAVSASGPWRKVSRPSIRWVEHRATRLD